MNWKSVIRLNFKNSKEFGSPDARGLWIVEYKFFIAHEGINSYTVYLINPNLNYTQVIQSNLKNCMRHLKDLGL